MFMFIEKSRHASKSLVHHRYREKAGKDAEDVLGRCQQLLKQAGLQGITIVEDDVKLFCKECHNLRLIRGYPMHEEINSVPAELLQELGKDSLFLLLWTCKGKWV